MGAAGSGLLIVAHLDPKKRGSLEQQLSAIAARAVAAAIPVHLVVARPPAPAVAADLDAAGATWTTLDFQHPFAAAAGLAAVAHRHRPALAHLHFLRPLSPIAHAAAALVPHVVMNDHLSLVTIGPAARSVAKHALLRFAGARITHRVAVSAHVAATVIAADGASPARLRVIPNGVDLARFAAPDPAAARRALSVDGTVIACISRMAFEKGVDVALHALARLQRPATLLVAGDGEGRAACARLAAELGITPRVRFLGLRDDVELILAAADQVWVPSRAEAFGLAAAEAMAAGRPVIASRVGGLPEVVTDGTGLLVPPGDPAALADAARALLDDPARAAALARAARARATTLYPLSRHVAQVTALYADLVPAWSALRR